MTPVLRRVVVLVGVLVALAHLAALPLSLEDLDSVNFALGVERFDVAAHRPHPPGYPVYIAVAKLSHAAIGTLRPEWSRERRAAVALAGWSALASGVVVWAIAGLWRAIGFSPLQAILAAVLAASAPLFWLTASRPLSDMPGLAAGVAVQWALMLGLRQWRRDGGGVPTAWWWAAAGAGLAVGLRSQTMWLTGPLLCWCLGELAGARRWREAAGLLGVACAGVLLWLVPMVVVTGGLSNYLAALGTQGTDDFVGVQMLATNPSFALLSRTLSSTFQTPWLDRSLALVVLALATIGVARLARRGTSVLALVLLAYWPYCVFHLTFQETDTIRYALPLVIPVAGLAVAALSVLPRRWTVAGTAALAGVAFWFAAPPLRAYASTPAPIFHALSDINAAGIRTIGAHHRVRSEARQVLVWANESDPLTWLPSRRGAEVDAVVNYFLAGNRETVAFLADPLRRDLMLIDARSRTLGRQYRWDDATRRLVAFMRPTDLDQWHITPPRWMAGPGWALTPEVAGVTAASSLGPHHAPAIVYLRRGADPVRLVIGGRFLGRPGDPPVTVRATLDGVLIRQWAASADTPSFQVWMELPDGVPSGEGLYAQLAVSAASEGSRISPVGLEFFDAAGADDVLWAYGAGWHEPELDPQTGVLWRWMSDQGTVLVSGPSRELELTIEGESPVRYFGAGTELVVRAGPVELARRWLVDDFTEVIRLPAAVLSGADGVIALTVSNSLVPAERGQSEDRRTLGVRIFQLSVTPAAR